jgi:hypothetical protein
MSSWVRMSSEQEISFLVPNESSICCRIFLVFPELFVFAKVQVDCYKTKASAYWGITINIDIEV